MEEKIKKVNKRKLDGIVVSDKMHKSCIVVVARLKKHPLYHKYYKLTSRFHVHDENNEYKIGDKVVIEETKPISKTKRWKVKGLSQKSKPKA